MINIVYSEIFKLRKSKILLLSLVAALGMPLLLDGAILITNDHRTFESFVWNSEGITFWNFYGILFSIIGGYIFSREYSEKTSSVLFSYSCSRTKIFIGKLIVTDSVIFFTCFVQSAVVYLSYYLLFGELEKDLVIADIKVNIYATLLQMAIVVIPILLANLKKNIVLPIVYGIFSLCVSLVMYNTGFEYADYNPLISSYLCFARQYEQKYVDLRGSIISAIICFIVFSIISIYQYNKSDMA